MTDQSGSPEPNVCRSLLRSRNDRFAEYVFSALCVVGTAVLFIIFNGGIDVGFSNHVELLPVVRRILDSNYLPGDFSIRLAYYHHRVFAYLIAACATLWGEHRALILLNLAGMLLLSGGLFYLCRTLAMGRLIFLIAALFIALNVGWAGLGFEANNFVGDREVYPPTFAHAFMLIGIASLLKGRYRLTALFAGLVVLFHVQIGVIFAMALTPFFAFKIIQFSAKHTAQMAALFLIPASWPFWHLIEMMRRGVTGSAFSIDYINFRIPHHFELISAAAAVWIALHLLSQVGAYEWCRRTGKPEFRMLGILCLISLVLGIFSVAHFIDYYWLKETTVLKFQFPRVSSFITVLGTLSLLLVFQTWVSRVVRKEATRFTVLVIPALLVLPALWSSRHRILEAMVNGHHGIIVRTYDDQDSPWVDICHWVRAHGPVDAVYITPPGNSGFTYLSDRSDIAEFKIAPDGGQYLVDWFTRMRDLGRQFAEWPRLC